jgi:hypothetical protein
MPLIRATYVYVELLAKVWNFQTKLRLRHKEEQLRNELTYLVVLNVKVRVTELMERRVKCQFVYNCPTH